MISSLMHWISNLESGYVNGWIAWLGYVGKWWWMDDTRCLLLLLCAEEIPGNTWLDGDALLMDGGCGNAHTIG